jgi:hypothetical protein
MKERKPFEKSYVQFAGGSQLAFQECIRYVRLLTVAKPENKIYFGSKKPPSVADPDTIEPQLLTDPVAQFLKGTVQRGGSC